ncbi:MAG: SpoIID/LytB domain-containing protein [Brevinematales bacterium]|nr:SpoIID/LytB domain-containing protein [Brevinematales bacterium]
MKCKNAIFVIIFLFLSCGEERPISKVAPFINVLLFTSDSANIEAENFVLISGKGREIGKGKINFTLSNNSIVINEMIVGENKFEISPENYFKINGKSYRGNLLIINTNGTLYFINIIDIESYLYSVVPGEVYSSWETEVLKAQTVVSRTYALYELSFSRGKNRLFDVYSDTRSQVYKGIESENELIRNIVNSTTGEVLRYNGKIIPAFFHSSSGGMTESSLEFFGYDKPYLIAKESPYAATFPENRWEYKIKTKDFSKIFNISQDLTSIKVTKRTTSKRIKEITISSSQSNIVISGKELRSKLGESNIKSLRANIFITNDTVLFQGVGYGHGVGFAQWDAQGMAKEGKDYKSILKFFYPGVSIEKIW